MSQKHALNNFTLFRCVFPQVYEVADPPFPDPRPGPVITVTSYSPAARFELSREPNDQELNKISRQIAAALTALVSANRLSLAQ